MLSVGMPRPCQRPFTLRFLSSMIWMSGKVSPDMWLSLPIHIFKHRLFIYLFIFCNSKAVQEMLQQLGWRPKNQRSQSWQWCVSTQQAWNTGWLSLPGSPSCCWIRFQFFFLFFFFWSKSRFLFCLPHVSHLGEGGGRTGEDPVEAKSESARGRSRGDGEELPAGTAHVRLREQSRKFTVTPGMDGGVANSSHVSAVGKNRAVCVTLCSSSRCPRR